MHIGVCIFATEYAIRIDELAREAENRGFESLWVPEHTHIPTSRRSPFAGGATLPEEYKDDSREEMREILRRKIEGQEVTEAPVEQP